MELLPLASEVILFRSCIKFTSQKQITRFESDLLHRHSKHKKCSNASWKLFEKHGWRCYFSVFLSAERKSHRPLRWSKPSLITFANAACGMQLAVLSNYGTMMSHMSKFNIMSSLRQVSYPLNEAKWSCISASSPDYLHMWSVVLASCLWSASPCGESWDIYSSASHETQSVVKLFFAWKPCTSTAFESSLRRRKRLQMAPWLWQLHHFGVSPRRLGKDVRKSRENGWGGWLKPCLKSCQKNRLDKI